MSRQNKERSKNHSAKLDSNAGKRRTALNEITPQTASHTATPCTTEAGNITDTDTVSTSTPSPRWIQVVIAGILLLVVGVGYLSFPRHPLGQNDITAVGGGYDYFYYHATVQALEQGLSNIYGSQEMRDLSRALSPNGRWEISDNHLLPFYLLYLPLKDCTFRDGYYMHLWLNLNLFWLACIAIGIAVSPNRYQAYVLTALCIAFSLTAGIAVDNIWLGQVGLALASCLIFIFLSDRGDYQKVAGIFLAIAILLKMYPALLTFYFAGKRRWQLLRWMAGTLLITGLLAGVHWGFDHYANYWHFLTTSMSYDSNLANQALIGWLAQRCPDFNGEDLKIAHLVLLIGASAGLIWLSALQRPHYHNSLCWGLLEFSLWINAATLLSPISWGHHHVILMLSAMAWIGLLLAPSNVAQPCQDASQKANASTTPHEQERPWNTVQPTKPLERSLSWAGLVLIALLWTMEGESVTQPTIKAWHYWFCQHHLGTLTLLAIVATQVGMLGREAMSSSPS